MHFVNQDVCLSENGVNLLGWWWPGNLTDREEGFWFEKDLMLSSWTTKNVLFRPFLGKQVFSEQVLPNALFPKNIFLNAGFPKKLGVKLN